MRKRPTYILYIICAYLLTVLTHRTSSSRPLHAAAAAVMCAAFPAKAYWRIEGVESDTPIIYINWGKYGEYELTMAADGESMAGSAKGKPEKWRKATRIRGLDEMLWKKRGREGCGGCKKGCGECGRDED